MTDLQIRQGYANGTLTDCDECGATMKNGGECPVCPTDEDTSPAVDPLAEAQTQHRAHSLIASQRTWQLQATIPGVCQAWGYAYENGNFNR